MKSVFDKSGSIIKRVWGNAFFASLVLFSILFVALTGILFFSGGDPQPDDHYFHFKYAYLLRTEGWDAVENFRWIYLLNDHDGVHRYSVSLFQLFLVPFTYFNDWFLGIHILDAFLFSCVVAIMYYIMRKEKVRYALFFTLLLFASTFFVKRFLLGRAFVLMVGLVYIEIYLAIRKKYISLFFVVMLHVMWHQATYFMPFVVVFFVEFSRYVLEKKVFLRNFFVAIAGALVGMAFYPGFPGSIINMMKQIFVIKDSTTSSSLGTMGGGEMATVSMTSGNVGHVVAGLMLFFCFWVVGYILSLQKRGLACEGCRIKGTCALVDLFEYFRSICFSCICPDHGTVF